MDIRLATRGSELAMGQAAIVADALRDRRHEVELVEVETEGDRIRDELIHRLGTTGAFVRSLDEEVLDGTVDAAVHSMKDMPTEFPDDLVVAGVPERAAAGDRLVTPDDNTLDELPKGAVVGTSSLRRQAQVRNRRSDLTVEPLRGNVDTRVRKLLAPHRQREHERRLAAEENHVKGEDEDHDEGAKPNDGADAGGDGHGPPADDRSAEEWFDDLAEIEREALELAVDTEYDAIVLAAAGLERSGLARHVPTHGLPVERAVPAPGQGAMAVTARDDDVGRVIQQVVDHPRTRIETTVERTILAELGGGCVAPIGVYALLQGSKVRTTVQVLDRAGEETVSATRELPVDDYVAGARSFAAALGDRGADDLIAAAVAEGRDG